MHYYIIVITWLSLAARLGSNPPTLLRGWRDSVELVLFGISISMKPYPSVFQAYAL